MAEEKPVEQPSEEKEPKEEKLEATKLSIFFPLASKNKQKTIIIKALTDKGEVDTSRDDEIEVSINLESRSKFADSSKKIKLKLIKGEVDAAIKKDLVPEAVILTANWVSGKSPLQKCQVSKLMG